MERYLSIISVLSLCGLLGCAGGGGQVQPEGVPPAGISRTDEFGFERSLGPAEIAYQSAQQFMSAGNLTEAISNLETAVSIRPNYLEAWSDLGRVHSGRKDFEKGIAAYEKALALSPGNAPLIAAIGYNYMNIEKYEKASEYFMMLVDEDPNDYIGNVNLAFIAQRRGNELEAIERYERALQSNPQDATTLGTLANLYGERGDNARRYEYLRRAIEAAPDNHQFKIRLARAYFNEKDYQQAVPLYEELAEIFPDDPDYRRRLGFALSSIDRGKEALTQLEKSIELGARDDPFTWALLARTYNENGQHRQAIESARSGLALGSGETAFLHYQWGEALSKQGDNEAANRRFDEAVRLYEAAIGQFESAARQRDATWSGLAQRQVERQQALIKRRTAERERAQYD